MSERDSPSTALSKQELEDLLIPQLGEDLIVDSYTCTFATQPGENYGSTMLALKIIIHRLEGSTPETLHAVAKLAPPSKFLLDIFDMPHTFCKEMSIYKLVGPEIQQLQKESGIPDENILDILPEYYGARTSLAGDQDPLADSNAVLVLQNLKIAGYKLANRLTGLDLKHCELAVSKLAQFHALPIALKQKKPHVFEKTVLKATSYFELGGGKNNPKEDLNRFLESLMKAVPESIPYMTKIKKRCLENINDSNSSLNKEPFATIVHNDFWTNNMMFCYNEVSDRENLSPTGIKFVDFQTTLLCSPVKDIIFFLFSSAADTVQEKYYNHLIDLYYTTFIDTLIKMGCNTSSFSFEKFQEEINEFAPTQFHHILFMLNVIYADKSDIKELSDLDGDDALKAGSGNICRHKLLQHIQEFDRRGWL